MTIYIAIGIVAVAFVAFGAYKIITSKKEIDLTNTGTGKKIFPDKPGEWNEK